VEGLSRGHIAIEHNSSPLKPPEWSSSFAGLLFGSLCSFFGVLFCGNKFEAGYPARDASHTARPDAQITQAAIGRKAPQSSREPAPAA